VASVASVASGVWQLKMRHVTFDLVLQPPWRIFDLLAMSAGQQQQQQQEHGLCLHFGHVATLFVQSPDNIAKLQL